MKIIYPLNPTFFDKPFTNYVSHAHDTSVSRVLLYGINPWEPSLYSVDSCNHTKAFASIPNTPIPIPIPPGTPDWFNPDQDFEEDFD